MSETKLISLHLPKDLAEWSITHAKDIGLDRTKLIISLLSGLKEGRLEVKLPEPNPFPEEPQTLQIYEGRIMQLNVIQNGVTLSQITFGGKQFLQVPGEGAYQIQLVNNSSTRKLGVVTIDGLNVINGEKGNLNGAGYVLEPFSSILIEGWRRTSETAASFVFDTKENSYNAQMGQDTNNIGVIGMAVFEEYKPIYRGSRSWAFNSSSSIPTRGGSSFCADAEGALRRLGTGYGKETQMKTTSVSFKKKSPLPSQMVVLQYGTKEQLESWGVPTLQTPTLTAPSPNPFPEASSTKAPPGWKAS